MRLQLAGAGAAQAETVDLSATGLRVADCSGASVGDRIGCELLHAREPLALSCRVVWTDPSDRGEMGLAFEDLNETRSWRLVRLVSRLRGSGASNLPIDPFCESGTWSLAAVVDDPVREETPLVAKLSLAAALILSAFVAAAVLVRFF